VLRKLLCQEGERPREVNPSWLQRKSGLARTLALPENGADEWGNTAECWRLLAVAGDDPVTENLVGGLDGVGINDEFLLARVLGDELEAELEVFEAGGA
jgi:hypothetical protein